jgi:uncharacterized membrane protein
MIRAISTIQPMRIRYRIISLITTLMLLVAAVPLAQAQDDSTVRAVMFWAEGCGHCDYVKANILPPLSARYGDRWQLELIELRSGEDFDRLFAMGAALGVPREAIGVPFLLIGDAILIGSGQIPAELPGLIEQHLAAGGVDWPNAPGLEAFLPELAAAAPRTVEVATTVPGKAAVPSPALVAPAAVAYDGFVLAIVILVGMVAALGYAAVRLWRAWQSRTATQPPIWTQPALPLLAVAGLGVAAYLAYVETRAVAPVCEPVGDCGTVQASEYAYLFGIPIGVLGLAGYLAILAAWLWGRWQDDWRAHLALLSMTAFGVLFSVYLTYLEPFVIGAVCAWCLTSAVIMTLLLVVNVETARPILARVRDGD